MYGSLRLRPCLNGKKAFQLVRCQVLTVFVRHMKPLFFGKVLNGVEWYQPLTHRLVEDSLYRFLEQNKGKVCQFAAVRLDLTGIAVFTHIPEQTAYHVPIYLF